MVAQSITKLQENELVEKSDDGRLVSTQFGDTMSKVRRRSLTMPLFTNAPIVLREAVNGKHYTSPLQRRALNDLCFYR